MTIQMILNELLTSYISNIIQPTYRSELSTDKAIELQDMLIKNYERKILEAIKEEHDKAN